jgi:hypothetical protein
MNQVRNGLLSRISCLRDPAEFGTAEISCRKMDEVGCTILDTRLHLLKRHISSLNILIWGAAICSHTACKSFAGLLTCCLVLGICEGSILAGFMIVTSMFYTRRELTARVGYWCENYHQPSFTPSLISNRLNDWSWFESSLL